ncbi:uncharacterized protein [Littorina saxatilis]|uniref:uncharacterized protein isoform X2 n=1 Tax=Littorina saxatilis TaxID=31220 RepID=UPI0038B4F0C1
MMTVVIKLVLVATFACTNMFGLLSAQQSTTKDPGTETPTPITTAATTTTTEDPGTGKVTLKRYCDFAARTGTPERINCLIDSKDPDSTVYWSLVTPGGQIVDLGRCTGMRNTCQSPLRPDVTLFRWYSWSIITFHNYTGNRAGSQLVCTATHFGRNNSDSCSPVFQDAIPTTTTTTTTTTTVVTTTEDLGTGKVALKRYCDFAAMTNNPERINCLIDSKDPDSTVYWSLVTPSGQIVDLGRCTGMRDTCQSPLRPDVTLFRWYSWSTITFHDYTGNRAGSQLVCTATHFGRNNSDSCYPVFQDATTTTTTVATTTEDLGTGEVNLARYCRGPIRQGENIRVNCLIDSKDPDSTVYWSLVTPSGQIVDLGRCTGMRNTCQSPLRRDVTLFRWYSWSTVTFHDYTGNRAGSQLVCTATHFGRNNSDSCSPDFQDGEVNLRRYCSGPISQGENTRVNCLIDSKDPESTVYWSLVTPSGQIVDLGRCTGMRNTCQSPLRPDVTLFRWFSWSIVTFHNYTGNRAGSQLVCTATHFGRNNSDACSPDFQDGSTINPPRGMTTAPTITSTSTTTKRPSTGNVTLDAYCSFPNQKRINCHIDSEDPQSEVQWALLTKEGNVRSLGNCSGLRGSCRTAPGTNVTLSRWYSWSTATFPDSADLSGSTLFCSASHLGKFYVSECALEDPTAEVKDCTRGRKECNSRGWQRNTGSINGVAVCCPPRPDNLGLSMNLNYRDHPCLCPK